MAVVVAGGSVLAARAVMANKDELLGAADALRSLNWGWLALAAGVEILAMVAYALLQQRLADAGRVHIGLAPLTAISFAGNSLALSLPGGAVWSYVFAYRQFRHRGADEALAAWVMVVASVLSDGALVVVAALGLAVAGGGSGPQGLVPVLAGVAAIVTAALALSRRPALLSAAVIRVLRLGQAVLHRPRRPAEEVVADTWRRLAAVQPGKRDLAVAFWWALANWVADCACLALAFAAVGAPVPWRGLLLAYGVAQLAALLPFTPGGLGLVEGSLTIALVAYGGSATTTVSAVLLYRIISFWSLLPIGWMAWAGLAVQRRRTGPTTELASPPP